MAIRSMSWLAAAAAALTVLSACGDSGDGKQIPRAEAPASQTETPASATPAVLELRVVAPPAPPGFPGGSGDASSTDPPSTGGAVEDALAWAADPSDAWLTALEGFTCEDRATVDVEAINPDEPLLACDSQGNRYLLTRTLISGDSLAEVRAAVPDGQVSWTVELELNNRDDAIKTLELITRQLSQNPSDGAAPSQLALVVDGVVLSAPAVNAPVTSGRMQISFGSGGTEAETRSLVERLKPR